MNIYICHSGNSKQTRKQRQCYLFIFYLNGTHGCIVSNDIHNSKGRWDTRHSEWKLPRHARIMGILQENRNMWAQWRIQGIGDISPTGLKLRCLERNFLVKTANFFFGASRRLLFNYNKKIKYNNITSKCKNCRE
jgi:hypothetical protein